MSELPTGTVTLLFTDIEGSTLLLQEVGGDRYARALEQHRALLRHAFTRHGGVEVDAQGDSFFFAFPQARPAVAAAAEAQRALAEHVWDGEPISVRIGVHTGEPAINDALYTGIDVHRAARVMAAGHGGQVLITETTRALVEADGLELPPLVDLGRHRLKDLAEPEHLFQLGQGDFPVLKTLNATNLPPVSGPLIGRDRELTEVLGMLNDSVRLLTITGPGGAGKTRFALQVAAELVGSLKDGVFWVPLASLPQAELVRPTIAQTLGARGDLVAHLRGKELLVLIDNAEHVLDAAVGLHELLASGEGVRLLVTSRAPLHVTAEREYALDTLPPADAAALFCARALAMGRELAADRTVAAICRRLDGLPLAIELAAARTKSLDPVDLLARLERALPLLTGGVRDAPRHQQTLRDTIEWSYELLSEEAQRAFASISVFQGGFSIEAADVVCLVALDVLDALVDVSLLKPIGRSRFLMLETIREFAGELLTSTGAREEVERRHSEFFVGVAREAHDWLRSPELDARVAHLDVEVGNLLATLTRLDSAADVDGVLAFGAGIATFLSMRGYDSYLVGPLSRAVAAPNVDRGSRAAVLTKLFAIASDLGDLEGARSYIAEALEYFREAGDVRTTVRSLGQLMTAEIDLGRIDAAKAHLTELIALVTEHGDSQGASEVEVQTANIALNTGDWETAVTASLHGLELRDDSSQDLVGVHLNNLMFAEAMLGDTGAALAAARKSLELHSRLGHVFGILYVLEGVAGTLAQQSPHQALELVDASTALLRKTGYVMERFESSFRQRTLGLLRAIVGDAAIADLGEVDVDLETAVDAARLIIDEPAKRPVD